MVVLRFPFGFTTEMCYVNGKERDGFILICKLADEGTYPFKLSITQHTAPSGSDTGPGAFVIPTGWQRKQHFLLFSTLPCALRRPMDGREVGGGCHLSSRCAPLPNQTEPEGLILALSALALSPQPRYFSCTTMKCFVPALLDTSQRLSKDRGSVIQS